jgi:hypothetical protein
MLLAIVPLRESAEPSVIAPVLLPRLPPVLAGYVAVENVEDVDNGFGASISMDDSIDMHSRGLRSA